MKDFEDDFDSDLYEDDDDEDALQDKYLTFRIGEESYGLEIRHVTEIIGVQNITPMPNMPEYVRGIINLRGTVIPVVDVRMRFAMETRAYNDRTCVIVVMINETVVGFVVDMVSEVIKIPQSDVEPPPRVQKGTASRFIQGLGKADDKVHILLDVMRLLYDSEPKPEHAHAEHH